MSAAYKSDPVTPTHRLLFKPVTGCETEGCYLDVIVPSTAKKGEKLPVAFMIHGGAWSVGASSDLAHSQVNYYLDKGFIVCSPEYRLCPHVKQRDCRQDILDAYTFVHARLNDVLGESTAQVDSSRIFATGGSAGGSASIALAIDIERHNKSASADQRLPQLRACVPAYPAIHQVGFQDKPVESLEQGLSKDDPALLEEIKAFLAGPGAIGFKTNSMPLDMSHPRNKWCNKAIEYQCLNSFLLGNPPYPEDAHFLPHIGSWFPPTYVLAAVKDTLIPVQHSYDLVDTLKSHGVEVHIGKGETAEHGFTEWQPSLWPEGVDWWDVIQEALDWAIGKTTA